MEKSLKSGPPHFPQTITSNGKMFGEKNAQKKMQASFGCNVWKVQMHKDVDENCAICDLEISKTLIHRLLNVQELRWHGLWLV